MKRWKWPNNSGDNIRVLLLFPFSSDFLQINYSENDVKTFLIKIQFVLKVYSLILFILYCEILDRDYGYSIIWYNKTLQNDHWAFERIENPYQIRNKFL